MNSSRDSGVRHFLRLTLARVEHLPGQSTPQWNSLWSIVVVEGAVTCYVVAAILIVLRLALGSGGLPDADWDIWLVIALAMLVGWLLCRGIENDNRTSELRARVKKTRGIQRLKESGLGAAFLVGGILSMSAASFFATRG